MLRLSLLCLLLVTPAMAAESLTIYATSNLFYAIDELNADFQTRNPRVKFNLELDSSDKITTRILRGESCDILLSADIDHPNALVRAGVARADSLTIFAVGQLAVWTMRADVDLSDLAALTKNPGIKRIAITNAEVGPYARASRQVMIRFGAWQHALPKLVLTETIIEASDLVSQGKADIGFISLSLALSPKLRHLGRYRELRSDPSTPLNQAVVLTKQGYKNRVAKRYLAYLASPEAKSVLARCGYTQPGS